MGHFMFLMLPNITKKDFMLIQHKLFGMCVVRMRKNTFSLNNDPIKINANLSYPLNLDFNQQGSCKGKNHNSYQMSLNFW